MGVIQKYRDGDARTRKIVGMCFVFTAGVLWGFSGACSELLSTYYGVPVGWIVSIRIPSAAVIFSIIALIKYRPKLVGLCKDKKLMPRLIAFAILGTFIMQLSYLQTIHYTNAGVGTVVEQLGLIFVVAFTCISTKRGPKIQEIAALVLAIGGTILITSKGQIGTINLPTEAIVWGAASAISIALYILLPSKIMDKWGTIPTLSISMLIAAVFAIVVYRPWQYDVTLTVEIVAAISVMLFLGTIVCYLLFMLGIRLCGPIVAGFFNCIEPVSAMAFTVIWLGSTISRYEYLGCLCIIVMMILIALPERKPKAEPPSQ